MRLAHDPPRSALPLGLLLALPLLPGCISRSELGGYFSIVRQSVEMDGEAAVEVEDSGFIEFREEGTTGPGGSVYVISRLWNVNERAFITLTDAPLQYGGGPVDLDEGTQTVGLAYGGGETALNFTVEEQDDGTFQLEAIGVDWGVGVLGTIRLDLDQG